jgi:sensor domain CHASE-containing protein
MVRLKIILVIIATTAALIGTLYLISSTLLLESYIEIENAQMEKNIVRVESGIENFNDSLYIKLRDWARWDDSYFYAQDGNLEFAESNLIDTALINLDINLLAYINLQNEIVFSKTIDLETQEASPSVDLVNSIISQISPLSSANPEGRVGGILKVQDGLLIIEALPILKTDETGPSTGTLIFGRYLDGSKVEQLEGLTQLSLEIFPLDPALLDEKAKTAQRMMNRTAPHFITPENEHTIAGYFNIQALEGKPVAIAKIESDRLIFKQGRSTVGTFALISSGCIFLLGLILLFLLERLLLNRFGRLSNEVDEISIHNLKSASITQGRQDEIGKLATKINHLLDELVRYQKKEADAIKLQQEANLIEKRNNEELRKSLEEKAGLNTLMVEREIKMIELKKEIAELKSQLADKGNS